MPGRSDMGTAVRPQGQFCKLLLLGWSNDQKMQVNCGADHLLVWVAFSARGFLRYVFDSLVKKIVVVRTTFWQVVETTLEENLEVNWQTSCIYSVHFKQIHKCTLYTVQVDLLAKTTSRELSSKEGSPVQASANVILPLNDKIVTKLLFRVKKGRKRKRRNQKERTYPMFQKTVKRVQSTQKATRLVLTVMAATKLVYTALSE